MGDSEKEPDPNAPQKKPRRPAHAFGIESIPVDFDDPLPPEIVAQFYGGPIEPEG